MTRKGAVIKDLQQPECSVPHQTDKHSRRWQVSNCEPAGNKYYCVTFKQYSKNYI